MAIKLVDGDATVITTKLEENRIKWLPALLKVDKALTAEYMAENFGLW